MPLDMDLVVIASTIVVTSIGYPLARAAARYIESRSTRPQLNSPEVIERLKSIERTVDSLAVEIERVTEHQRFVTKLLTEQRAAAGALPSSTGLRPEKDRLPTG